MLENYVICREFRNNRLYVTCIRKTAMLVGPGEPLALETFMNTLPARQYQALFPTKGPWTSSGSNLKNSHQGEDGQLAGQSTSTPFMDIKDSTISSEKGVLVDNHKVLDAKIH